MVKKSAEPAKKVAGPATKQPTRAAAGAAPVAAAATKSPPPAARASAAKTAAKTAAGSPAAAPPAPATASKPAPSTSKDAVKNPAPAKKATKATETVETPIAAVVVAAEPVRARPSTKKPPPPPPPALVIPPVKGETKDGIKYTKDFDAKFLTAQYKLLIEARESLTGQALRLEDEANSLIDEEMGDVQFDDESGEGDTLAVERDFDLARAAAAMHTVEEIDAALDRVEKGTYGICEYSGERIPKERLEAIPYARERVEYKTRSFR